MAVKTHILGDVKAEDDKVMLNRAYFETRDYRSLMDSAGHCIIVGRRGTGKSALCYKMGQQWKNDNSLLVLRVLPQDHQLMTMRHYVGLFNVTNNILRAAAKTFWRYALMMEVANMALHHYRYEQTTETETMLFHLTRWNKSGTEMFERLSSVLDKSIDQSLPGELKVPRLVKSLCVEKLQEELQFVLQKIKKKVRILIDRLDEGFEPTDPSVALVGGATLAVDLLNSAVPEIRAYVFVRDNIARSIAISDPDYSRNLESKVMRLHWDEQTLFEMICRRLRAAFSYSEEKDLKTWDRVTAQDVTGRDGFRTCLRLTLYRPRDLILLLNKAFYRGSTLSRTHIDNSDINAAAKEISDNRKRDLIFEYSSVIPGLGTFVEAFADSGTNFTYNDAMSTVSSIKEKNASVAAMQTLEIYGDPSMIVRQLYSIGFIGVVADQGGSFIFSHDGKNSDKEFFSNTSMLIHPCYWMALNLQEQFFNEERAMDIHDDEDVEVVKDNDEIRNKRLGQIISQLHLINEGREAASEFEEWCKTALAILFAGSLENVRLHPNHNATQRRDVIGRNLEKTPFWSRVYKDYGVRQAIFEVKNYSRDLSITEYRQVSSYMGQDYGRLAFIINRSESENLERDSELSSFQEIFYFDSQRKVIVKITAKMLSKLLSKLRSEGRALSADERLDKLLDTYETRYKSLGGKQKRKSNAILNATE